MSVHYKFKSALEYDTVTFDGLHISVKDLKNAIVQQKRIGKSTDFDLQVTNAQTKEVYEDENALIPKNTSLLIARIPNVAQTKSKQWEGYAGDSTPPSKTDELGAIGKATDLSSLDAPEEDKIKAMMSQSTQDYDPSNYMKIRGANQVGAVPPNYRCYKCHTTGHWIKDCPLGQGPEPVEIKKSTGIPRSFMVPVEGPEVPGAMMTPNGQYAVPVLDHEAYNQKPTPVPPTPEPKLEIPEELVCSICSDLLTDAVMIPCCGNSFCDECIRCHLLESEDHECPDCHEKDISPGTLIPNRFLRTSVSNFKNTTGYVKKPVYRPPPLIVESKKARSPTPTPAAESEKPADEVKSSESEKKTVISEADSTESTKAGSTAVDFAKDIDIEPTPKSETNSEGPPGVSPKESPKGHAISNRVSNSSSRERTSSSKHHKKSKESGSPKRRHRNHRSPSYSDNPPEEERPGTPTVDEPGGTYGSSRAYPSTTGSIPPPVVAVGPPPVQGPPPQVPPYAPGQQPPVGPYPTPQGPPPNFRLPPPGTGPPPFIAAGPYSVPPRPYFDGNRPPLNGPPPYSGYSGPRHHRDYNDRRMRNRTPPGVIDDPLAAFNRMLREKDERERKAKQRYMRRSYSRSRSRSRSRSYSRSPKRVRGGSRSPRRRQSRSRSRSFSISRSRSRSFTGSTRGSPFRDLSPRHSPPPRRRGPSRYRSPIRSPPRHRGPPDRRDRDFDRDRDLDRNFDRDDYRDRGRNMPDRDRGRDMRDRDRDYHYYDNYDDRGRGKPQWNQPVHPRNHPDPGYYPPVVPPQHAYPAPPNRYPPRDYPPPYMKNEPHVMPPGPMHVPPMHKIDDIAPPGVDEPPVPGLEDEPKNLEEEKPERIEKPIVSPTKDHKDRGSDRDRHERLSDKPERGPEKRREERTERKRRHSSKHTPSPDQRGSVTPQRKSTDKESPDKHKKKKRDDSSDRDRKRDYSDDEKSKKSKDKKKKKEKKEVEKKKRKERKDKHEKHEKHKKEEKEKKYKVKEDEKKEEEKKESTPVKEIIQKERTPEPVQKEKTPVKKHKEDIKSDLYGDIISEDIDKHVVETYVKYEKPREVTPPTPKEREVRQRTPEIEIEIKDEDSEKDILEIHTNDIIDLKTELDAKNEVLAPLPEKSKWEVDDDSVVLLSPTECKSESKYEKGGKVTNEVLKRAENAIFAKAINAIRQPIEIKKISLDRAKLYSGERDVEKKSDDIIQVTIQTKDDKNEHKRIEPPPLPQPTRISVKDRLGIKVEDTDKIIRLDKSPSPLLRRVELENRRRRNERLRRSRSRDRHIRSRDTRIRDHRRDDYIRRDQQHSRRDRRDDRRTRTRHEEPSRHIKRRRSRSISEEKKDKKKKKEKKQKKEKTKRHKDDDEVKKVDIKVDKDEDLLKLKAATEKRKPTLDEASFEPDYDLESESDKDDVSKASDKEDSPEDEKSSSSSSSSESSSEEERRKKKHKKHKKKKSKRDSSSSSSESDSDSSDDERERRRKKHKKKQKKKKKSKHR